MTSKISFVFNYIIGYCWNNPTVNTEDTFQLCNTKETETKNADKMKHKLI